MPMVPPVLSETPIPRHQESETSDEAKSEVEANAKETATMHAPNPPDSPDAPLPEADLRQEQTQPPASDSPSKRRTPASLNKPGQVPPAGAAPVSPPTSKFSFHLPNGKVGVAYAARLEGRDAEGRPARILEAKVPAGLGLDFDPGSGELRGMPAVDGDHRIPLRWTLDGSASYSSDCLLIVNPDPKSLWKVIEPPEDAPYRKPHADCRWLMGQSFRMAAASRRGRSHEHSGTFRDDDFFIHLDPETQWAVILVADGAGSAKFSRQGSRLAVATAGGHLVADLAGDVGSRMNSALERWGTDPERAAQAMGTEFHYLFHQAGTLAVQAIEQEARMQGAEVREYATTLLAAAIRRQDNETFLATFWMGDGAIAAYGPRARVRLMGTPDGGEFAGQTRFLDRAALSDQGFAKRIGIGRYPDLTAVMLMTDGVSDPRFETDNGLNDSAKWDALWDEIAPLLTTPEPDKSLLDWLRFFTPGHHDDRTLALLW